MKFCMILDDLRSIDEALDGAHKTPEFCFDRQEWTFNLARTPTEAMGLINEGVAGGMWPTYDLWILDNDLGVIDGEKAEGYEFLKDMMEYRPDLVPAEVVSCSANPERRRAIELHFRNWNQNGRGPISPIGS